MTHKPAPNRNNRILARRRQPRHCGDEGLRCLTSVRPRKVEWLRYINRAARFRMANQDCPF